MNPGRKHFRNITNYITIPKCNMKVWPINLWFLHKKSMIKTYDLNIDNEIVPGNSIPPIQYGQFKVICKIFRRFRRSI